MIVTNLLIVMSFNQSKKNFLKFSNDRNKRINRFRLKSERSKLQFYHNLRKSTFSRRSHIINPNRRQRYYPKQQVSKQTH